MKIMGFIIHSITFRPKIDNYYSYGNNRYEMVVQTSSFMTMNFNNSTSHKDYFEKILIAQEKHPNVLMEKLMAFVKLSKFPLKEIYGVSEKSKVRLEFVENIVGYRMTGKK